MQGNTWRRVVFLVNLMFHRLDKFDGPIIGEGSGRIYECGGGLYRDVNWVTYLGTYVYSGGLCTGRRDILTGFYGNSDVNTFKENMTCISFKLWIIGSRPKSSLLRKFQRKHSATTATNCDYMLYCVSSLIHILSTSKIF